MISIDQGIAYRKSYIELHVIFVYDKGYFCHLLVVEKLV
jgi:hypothetical protein